MSKSWYLTVEERSTRTRALVDGEGPGVFEPFTGWTERTWAVKGSAPALAFGSLRSPPGPPKEVAARSSLAAPLILVGPPFETFTK